jgi:hypothetical protein
MTAGIRSKFEGIKIATPELEELYYEQPE